VCGGGGPWALVCADEWAPVCELAWPGACEVVAWLVVGVDKAVLIEDELGCRPPYWIGEMSVCAGFTGLPALLSAWAYGSTVLGALLGTLDGHPPSSFARDAAGTIVVG
jgi:hypothetical protein